jgi:hypothetical protein
MLKLLSRELAGGLGALKAAAGTLQIYRENAIRPLRLLRPAVTGSASS